MKMFEIAGMNAAFVRGEGEPFGTGKFPEMPALLPRPLVAIARTMVPF